jgi:hypothetical protein
MYSMSHSTVRPSSSEEASAFNQKYIGRRGGSCVLPSPPGSQLAVSARRAATVYRHAGVMWRSLRQFRHICVADRQESSATDLGPVECRKEKRRPEGRRECLKRIFWNRIL